MTLQIWGLGGGLTLMGSVCIDLVGALCGDPEPRDPLPVLCACSPVWLHLLKSRLRRSNSRGKIRSQPGANYLEGEIRQSVVRKLNSNSGLTTSSGTQICLRIGGLLIVLIDLKLNRRSHHPQLFKELTL